MESGAIENLDFGDNFSDLAVKDQYGRVMDMSNQDTLTPGKTSYYVEASAPAGSSITVNPNSNKAYNAMNIQLEATGAEGSGSTTVTYTVMQHVNGTDASTDIPVSGLTPVTQQYTVVNTTDIKDYTMDKIGTLYDAAADSNYPAAITPNVTPNSAKNAVAVASTSSLAAKQTYIGSADLSDFSNEAHVYGLTSGGGKVALANTDIISASVDNSNDFVADLRDNYYGTAVVGVYAKNTLSTTKPTATGNLTVTIKSADGLVHTASTAINSKDDTPVATSVGLDVDKADGSEPGTHVYASPYYRDMTVVGNNVTMNPADFYNYVAAGTGSQSNGIMSKRSADGNTSSTSLVYFYGVDQYGTKDAPFTSWTLSVHDANGNDISSTSGLTLENGVLTSSGQQLASGDIVTINGVTSNGLVESVNIYLSSSSLASTGSEGIGNSGSSTTTTAPVITLNGTSTVDVANGATYTDAGATATENGAAVAVTSVITDASGNVLTAIPTTTAGTYTVTYTATDAAGNKTSATRTVVVAAATSTTAASVDLTSLAVNTTAVPYTTIVTFKLANATDTNGYTVTVKGVTAQYNSTTGTYGAAVTGTLATSNFAASDFVVTAK
jgi:hypothetical protein